MQAENDGADGAASAGAYHEQQSLMCCAQHALNNLLQRPAVGSEELDALAVSIGGRFSLRHRWPLLGNHDANVLLLALQRFCEPPLGAEFWDARRRSESELQQELLVGRCRQPGVIGLIVNVASRSLWTLYAVPSRHWYAIRRVDVPAGAWALHDSRDERPRIVRDSELCEQLRRDLCERDAQILIVGDNISQ